MSEIRMLCLENPTKNSLDFRCSDFGHSSCLVCLFVGYAVNARNPKRLVGQVDQSNV